MGTLRDMRKTLAIVLVWLAALAACNDAEQPAATSTTAPAQVTPTTGEPTKEQMATQYLTMIDRLSPLVAELNDLSGNGTLAEFNALCADLSTAAYDAMSKATTDQWSEDLQPLITDWVKAVSELRNHFDACSHATSNSDVADALNPLQTANAHDESSLIRIALGLPAN